MFSAAASEKSVLAIKFIRMTYIRVCGHIFFFAAAGQFVVVLGVCADRAHTHSFQRMFCPQSMRACSHHFVFLLLACLDGLAQPPRDAYK